MIPQNLPNKIGRLYGRVRAFFNLDAGRFYRQDDMKTAAGQALLVLSFRFHPDAPTVCFNHPFGNRQSQTWPGAFKFGITRGVQLRIADAKEFLENKLMVLGRNADTGVADDDFQIRFIIYTGQLAGADMDTAVVRRLFHRITQQICKRLHQPLKVCINGRRLIHAIQRKVNAPFAHGLG